LGVLFLTGKAQTYRQVIVEGKSMKQITGRTGSGKKVRVAATFTGATAFAAVFTPTLGTAAHASSLRSAPCAGRPTWLHLREPVTGGFISTCWGFKGGRSLPDLADSQYCGGNNYGFVIWFYSSGAAGHIKSVPFHQGTTFARAGFPYDDVAGVHISGWKGDDKCP
jgi:hypothetical protein